ncbi:MAG: hypothetical protein EMLJLAPB_01003 [Candidatus Argoarchaeum ethanivorans]|uniref:DUF1616 domain-containing protein n=1 Tax=Candidatus Argoarchaeum ethanivorans TaxID=2608793 RepID=A0A811TEL9_9EURY|nr:MAG: hypothetical protein FFODKBPE_00356 [Candidatus Argoarchaeum ethanivorans]CAD6494892.1 MAG: hypothetical protein EMLJLAPB_01003 [Candidatus Argoarchaeum ethanivorans]
MEKSKFVYIGSLVILTVLLVLVFYHPVATEGKYSEVQWVQLLEKGTERIIQFDIINHEQKDINYTIIVTVDEKKYTEDVLIRKGGKFTYIHHIYPERLTEGDVTFVVYKEGESLPIEEVTYCLK